MNENSVRVFFFNRHLEIQYRVLENLHFLLAQWYIATIPTPDNVTPAKKAKVCSAPVKQSLG